VARKVHGSGRTESKEKTGMLTQKGRKDSVSPREEGESPAGRIAAFTGREMDSVHGGESCKRGSRVIACLMLGKNPNKRRIPKGAQTTVDEGKKGRGIKQPVNRERILKS